jgi:hypothetical protein
VVGAVSALALAVRARRNGPTLEARLAADRQVADLLAAILRTEGTDAARAALAEAEAAAVYSWEPRVGHPRAPEPAVDHEGLRAELSAYWRAACLGSIAEAVRS